MASGIAKSAKSALLDALEKLIKRKSNNVEEELAAQRAKNTKTVNMEQNPETKVWEAPKTNSNVPEVTNPHPESPLLESEKVQKSLVKENL